MKCPHCLESFKDNPNKLQIGVDKDGKWELWNIQCPSCGRFVMRLVSFTNITSPMPVGFIQTPLSISFVRPKALNRRPLPSEVKDSFASDYAQACLILTDSPNASAALSRRCLQHILREKAGVTKGNLADEIQQVLDSRQLPSYLADSLDAVRNTGNFAAHPIKSKSSSEIVDVEPGEAEWNLDVIEALFDFFFVQPEVIRIKREDLNKKLIDAGKLPMK
jgi:hypothetical protein